jgi:tRNA A-37 threonylcarbamoyl transferase component Bud32/tetratricopeptide (TPR) repeat protein
VDGIGRTLSGRYRLERVLGQGGMAIVYLADDLKHGRKVAVKVFRPELAVSLGAERFLREVEIASQLNHPHILPLHDSGESEGLLFYVMPYVEGETLRQRLQRERQLPLDDALEIAREVADALSYAHSQGVVHRDVKPENILFSAGHAVVADFGVARAISAAATAPRTATGLAIGTPLYMSPEQASGATELDGRADLYALGCILFEMLAGEPPFTGPTPQAVLAQHVQERPRSLRVLRPTVPPHVERAVATLLAKIPADRFRTASQFVTAITSPHLVVLGGRAGLRRAAAVLAVAVPALVAAVWAVWPEPPLDTSRYLVASFGHGRGEVPRELGGDLCQWRLAEGLRRWEGINVPDDFEVRDALARQGAHEPTLREWLKVARSLKAATVVRGEVSQVGDSVYVTAVAYRVDRREEVARAEARFLPDSTSLSTQFERLAARLLGLEPPASAGAWSTTSLSAYRAYVNGHQALDRGELAVAATRFSEASQADPEFADAHFWLAQAMAWSGRPTDEWAFAAQRAVNQLDRLTDRRGRVLAEPLLALARGRYQDACDAYWVQIARDSADFAAWVGLGECYARDETVLRDSASPSGWRFRTSFRAAAEAYRRGLSASPSLTGALFNRLRSVLPIEPAAWRTGRAVLPDTATFLAYPALEGDTIAFIPYPSTVMREGRPELLPASQAEALARNRAALHELATSWVEAYPASPRALQASATMLEVVARTAEGDAGVRTALGHLRAAARLAREPALRFRVAHHEARLLVKLRRFAEARRVADSVLESGFAPNAEDAARLAGLAALAGRARRAAQILGAHASELMSLVTFREVPLSVLQAREELRAYAALGAPVESLRVLPARVDTLLRMWAGAQVTQEVRTALLEDPMAWAYPTLGLEAVRTEGGVSDLARAQRNLARGESAAVREWLRYLREARRRVRPQEVAMARTFQEAWMESRLGDSAAAAERLDLVLGALPGLATTLLSGVPDAAGLVRAMALRGELAARMGDRRTARVWLDALEELWGGGDPEFQFEARRLNALVGRAGP